MAGVEYYLPRTDALNPCRAEPKPVSEKSKYETGNPIQRWLVERFLSSAATALRSTGKRQIVEIGCADGYVYAFLQARLGVPFDYAGYDVDGAAIVLAKQRYPEIHFEQGDIYGLAVRAEIVLCLEVLEHLSNPERALRQLAAMDADDFIVSVPHEPWFALGNLARFRHLATFGNRPNHVNHWGKATFRQLLAPHFDIVQDYSSFPWIMYLLRKAGTGSAEHRPGPPQTRATRLP
jgi:SAM-dependent methyltransferase